MNRPEKKINKKSILRSFLPILAEVLPILFERIMELQGKPTLKKLQEENEELNLRISYLEKKMFWFMIFIIIQTLFILSLVFYLILKS